MKHIHIVVHNGTDEGRLMKDLVSIIEGSRFQDQFPHLMEGTSNRSYVLDTRNDWFASLGRKGDTLHAGEPPLENDTLDIWYRYGSEPLMAIKPWLEYRFSPKTDHAEIAD